MTSLVHIMKTCALELDHVSAGYEQNRVIEDLSLAVAEGEMAAFLGPNGAGKSTLLRTLTGLLKPLAGVVSLFGSNVARLKTADRARLIAVVPQEFNTPMAYTVAELAMIGRTALLKPWQQPSPADIQVVERALVYTDVSDLRDRPLDALSGGEKQRAVIAMALAQEPRIIVMDEPTTHLDLNHSLEIMQIIERLNREQGVTVLMTSHDLNLAAEFCRRLILMDHGRVVADGTPAAVLKENTLREVYHCELRIREDTQSGAIFVAPARRLSLPHPANAVRIHVIAGGGSGGELLRRLALCGYRVSCGALNQQDSDAQTAGALGMTLALEKPFYPIGADALGRARQLAADAQAVVLCEVPFGPGNLVNLDIVEDALRRGIPVFVNDRNLEHRDYTAQRAAVARIRQLLQSGAAPWRLGDETLAALASLSQSAKA
jgi:iron complex transport system ATP-binding protein